MRRLSKDVSFKKIFLYGGVFSFFLIFSFILIQPRRYQVARTMATSPGVTRASYASLRSDSGRKSGDIYLELINSGSADEGVVITYLVERGDTLSSIAKQFGTTSSEISEQNNIVLGSTLSVGQPLVITFEEGTVVPVPETMTIKTFTQKYGLDYEEFLSINYFDEGADLLEKDDEVFVQLNEQEALRVGLLQKEDFVRLDFEIPKPKEDVNPSYGVEPSQEMIDLVNDIVNEDIADDNQDIVQRDLEQLDDQGNEEPSNYEQQVINSEGSEYNPITSEVYEQVIIDAQETQQYLEALKQKKKEELEAAKRAEEEKIKAQEAERQAQIAREQQLAQEERERVEEEARQAQLRAQQAQQEAEQARIQAQQAERQAAIAAQQAVGIEQDYIAPPIVCGENQCAHNDRCYSKPEFAECAPHDPNEAWICRGGYVESGGDCVKNIPAPASDGKILKQRYFNPHKADSRVRGWGAGQCTAGVAYLWAQNFGIDMRRDLGMRGNAAVWGARAREVGLTTSKTPIPGSIGRTARSHGYYGHVVYVDEVYLDEGLMLITDMNYRGAYQFTQRIERIDRMDGFIYPPG